MSLSLSHNCLSLPCYPFPLLALMTHTTHAYDDEAFLCNLCRRIRDTSLANLLARSLGLVQYRLVPVTDPSWPTVDSRVGCHPDFGSSHYPGRGILVYIVYSVPPISWLSRRASRFALVLTSRSPCAVSRLCKLFTGNRMSGSCLLARRYSC